jgi:cupin fold WbuC family metalloprotein
MTEPVKLITDALLDETAQRAAACPRLRMNFNFHSDDGDNPHRFLNAIRRHSYCTPHRHVTPPKAESFLILRGKLAFLLFDDAGTPSACYRLGENGLFGVDVSPGAWHTVVALSDVAICYEVKAGPYEPIADKDFAPWAPREGTAEAITYLTRLERYLESRDDLRR